MLWFNSETENVAESSKLMAVAATARVHTKKILSKEKKTFLFENEKGVSHQ